MLLSEAMNQWLQIHKFEISDSSAYTYTKNIDLILREFGDKEINTITRNELNEYFIKLRSKGLSTSSIITRKKVINMTMKYAVQNYVIYENVCDGTIFIKEINKEVDPYTVDEVLDILKVPMRSWMRDAISIAFRTGMRKSEIFALQKSDVNFEENFIQVRHTLSYSGSHVISKQPKTKSSIRRIDADEITIEILKQLYDTSDCEYLFCKNRTFIIPWSINSYLRRICDNADVRYRSFHNFRHTHATILLSKNVHPKIVQERLGHSKISTTLDTYSHLVPGMQYVATDIFNSIK